VARREERLRELAGWADREHGVPTTVVVADLATEEGLAACRAAVDAAAGAREVAVLNAGFGASGPAWTIDRARQSEMVRLNCEAVTDLAAHVLPGMVERGAGASGGGARPTASDPAAPRHARPAGGKSLDDQGVHRRNCR